MSESPNKLIKFWQELKRRKVFGVVTTYAATAYIIIEVTNNLVEPLSLPAGIAKLVILFLGAGLPIVVILSWIFDFTPQGLKKTESLEELEGKEIVIKPVKRKLRASYVLNAVLIITVIVLAYPKIFKQNTLEKLRSSGERISIAVMPFQNMTNDPTWNIWQDGIQISLISSLSNSAELTVRQPESVGSVIKNKELYNYASITPSVASTISQKLDANVFIYGNIMQAGAKIRINAQLINSKSKDVFKSFQIDDAPENILPLIDSLSERIRNSLIISKLRKKLPYDDEFQELLTSDSPEAFIYVIQGRKAFYDRDYPSAVKLLSQAIDIDSNLIVAISFLSLAYRNQGVIDQAKKWCLKAYEKRDRMTMYQRTYINWQYACEFETPNEAIIYCKQLLEFDDQNPGIYFILGNSYRYLYQYDKAITAYEKALEIYYKWGSKPLWIHNYNWLGYSYHESGQYRKERMLYKKSEKDFPDALLIIARQAVLALTEGKIKEANDYIEKYKSIGKENSISESVISTNLANIYSEADLDKAEEYFRQALSLEPENSNMMNTLAWFLIDNDRNIDEGMELIDKALIISPENFYYLHTKGWGLCKQGKFEEALDVLQNSWDLRMKNAIYNHEAYLHLEAAKKAVAELKNN